MSGLSLEEYDLLGDSKYRAYVAAVDKTLRNFENTSEWADLISTLGKLNKVLLSHMKYPVVPRRITISKRLAQCMHPALPSGVHLKALETYDIIFKCMGTNRLSQELFIYSAGLFPLFSSAAMNVRSALLTVYETHFVPLGPRLRPGLNGFLSGILAGLEEGSDHLERTSQLLTRVAEGVGQAEFFGCLWDCVWGNSGVRLPAITHITSCYNKKLSTEDQLYILGTNIDVMVSALCQAMEDSSVLVQRAALDLTLAALPMHNTQLLRPDLVRIVTSAILVLLRRDMSLNRRLYAWLLGSEINLSLLSSEHPVVKRLNSAVSDSNTEDGTEVNAYFETFSRPLLVEGVVSCLQASQGTNPPDLRPYRLIVSLLDKPEIGPFILDDIFLDLLRCLYHTCQVLQASNNTPSEPSSRRQSTTDKQTPPPPSRSPDGSKPVIEGNRGLHEVTKTATLLFSALQPSYPWMHLTGLLSMACQAKASQMDGGEKKDDGKLVLDVGSSVMTVCEICTLLQHLLTSLPHDTQQQTQASRLPEVLSTVTSLLTEHLSTLTAKELSAGLSLSQAILHKLIPSVTLPPSASQSRPDSRASITTFASLQMHALSQVSTIPRPLLVQEAFARESPPSECGIVQIGIEASEDDPNSIERKKTEDLSVDSLTDESNNNENLVDGEAETSFISVVSNSSMEDSERLKGEAEGENKEKQDSSVEKENEMTTTNAIKPEISEDLFEIDQDGEIVNSSEDKHANLEEVPSDSGVDMEEIPSQPTELARFLISQEAIKSKGKKVQSSPWSSPSRVSTSSSGFSQSQREITDFTSVLQLHHKADEQFEVFKAACSILVDLSSLPTTPGLPLNRPSNQIPHWFVGLIACVINGSQVSPRFVMASVSTLLELVMLAQSELSVWRSEHELGCKGGPGVVSVNIIPLLLPTHTHILLHHTTVYQHMARQLWSHLRPSMSHLHVGSTELLLQLHNLTLPRSPSVTLTSAPPQSPMSVVEREILATLTYTLQVPVTDEKESGVLWSHEGIRAEYDSVAMHQWMTLWQEVSGKLLECCSSIAGSCLEATTWLRRNLTVKTDTTEKKDGMNDASAYSVAALSVLAELLAPLLDVLYVSEEKDKVVPLLTNIMANVVPYLRNHTRSNMPAFAACSQLLSSLSGYQYTLRAWRRDVIDLLLDPQAFMMLPPILTYWRTIVDFLCTHDKTVFKELLTRVSMSQGGSLSLFSSKESEYEIRAGLLKRLAFTIFCSETDQYMRHIPDIQERLAEVTRLGQVVPSLVAQVLLCFRVLLLRMSPRGVTSLWPVIITELVQVFLMMEQELATDTEQFSKKGGSSHLKRLSTLDSSWVFSSQNGLNAHNHPAWLTLYLAACKLLDLMLALPAQHLPQFQMYRWAFVGPVPTTDVEEKTEGAGNILLKSCDFVPHIARIAKLMADKPGSGKNKMLEHRPGELLLKMSSISTLLDLQPFFNTLTSPSFTPAAATIGQSPPGILSSFPSSTSLPSSGPSSVSGTSATPNSSLAHIEAVIERDFLEPLPS
ncbi:putative protein dopey-1-like [Penaeus vannamei]|uniref:Uncharacterized protein n=1 Tax=Penaeus vannamei TaxID=6689 RepID=A0A423SAZ6_PENVA|nr:putative protein dopey-1-like [Penaeus vannamei]